MSTLVCMVMLSESRPGTVSVPLGVIAVGSLIVALASVATLIVVVSARGIDALSTLALSLAVIAFVVQLIVFIVQTAEAARSSRQGQELHASLMSLLSQIEERTQGTQASVDRMNTRLLEALIGKARGEGLEVGSTEFAERISSGMTGYLSTDSSAAVSPSAAGDERRAFWDWPAPLPKSEALALHAELLRWPKAEEVGWIRSIIDGLDDRTLMDMRRLARDLKSTTSPNTTLGPGLSLEQSNALVQQGLAEKVPGWKLYTLSEKGRRVGRLFTAEGPPPDGLEELAELRDRINRLHEERLASLSRRE